MAFCSGMGSACNGFEAYGAPCFSSTGTGYNDCRDSIVPDCGWSRSRSSYDYFWIPYDAERLFLTLAKIYEVGSQPVYAAGAANWVVEKSLQQREKIELIVCCCYSIINAAFRQLISLPGGGRSLALAEDSKRAEENLVHEKFMREALKEARKAYAKDEAPIGAVIVKDGVIVARGHNEREIKQDATLHAEITAIRKACKKLGSWRLNDCDMYVTLEPCAMCAGALVQSRLRKVYFGAPDPKAGAAGSVVNLLEVGKFNHKVEAINGVLEEECSSILKEFFRELRKRKS